ncbi:MAG: hypothetical protein ACFFCI_00540 [Promethearchaeota archaeon]
MSFLETIWNTPGRLLAGIINAINPFRWIAYGLFYFAVVIAAITLVLMAPGITFAVIPQLAGVPLLGTLARDLTDGVLNQIIPLWFALLTGLAVVADIFLDILIIVINFIMTLIDPPRYQQVGFFVQQVGGWHWIPFNPLTTLISQLFDFYKTATGAYK